MIDINVMENNRVVECGLKEESQDNDDDDDSDSIYVVMKGFVKSTKELQAATFLVAMACGNQ